MASSGLAVAITTVLLHCVLTAAAQSCDGAGVLSGQADKKGFIQPTNVTADGGTIELLCQKGYYYNQSASSVDLKVAISCKKGIWKIGSVAISDKGEDFKCVRGCPKSPVTYDIESFTAETGLIGNVYLQGTEGNITCIGGYSADVTCGAKGQWSGQVPTECMEKQGNTASHLGGTAELVCSLSMALLAAFLCF